jgi:hypothetical protein
VKPLFSLGHVAATPGALAALEKSGQQPGEFLARHVSGEWGEIPPEDIKENQFSLKHSFRPLSAYHTSVGGQAPGDYRSRPFVYLYVESGLRDFLENPA